MHKFVFYFHQQRLPNYIKKINYHSKITIIHMKLTVVQMKTIIETHHHLTNIFNFKIKMNK